MPQLRPTRFAILLVLVATLLPLSLTSQQVRPVSAASFNDIMLNGDFSNGLLGWTTHKVASVFGVRGEYPIFEVLAQMPLGVINCTPSGRQGNRFLSIDSPFGADGYVEQQVTIPSSGGHLSFVSWGWENNYGLVNSRVVIVDASGFEHTLEMFIPPPMINVGDPNNPNDDSCTGNSPFYKSYDLSAFSGQTIKLRLGSQSDNCCGTVAAFDDVKIEAQGIAFHCPSDAGFHALTNS